MCNTGHYSIHKARGQGGLRIPRNGGLNSTLMADSVPPPCARPNLGFAVGQPVFAHPQVWNATDVQAPEWAEAIHAQVLERHVHRGIEHDDVPPHAVGVQTTGQLAVPELGDVNKAQLIQGQVTKLAHKQRVSLLRLGLELAAVCGRVFAHVNAIRI